MTTVEASVVPVQGQLVTVRNRQWVTSDVVRSEIASSDPHFFSTPPTHLVTLVSIEDDAREETLQVIWELEIGAVVHETAVLPGPEHGFDHPAELDAFLDAVRWGAIASADTTALQAPFRSGIQIEDYQLDPVVRALSMPRTNLLIADDVGMGKTIEAGLVMQELALRHRARTMLIVCPAGLTLQWRDEMRDKFGLDFRIVDSDLLKQLRRTRGPHTNPWTHYPRLIVSIDWLKRTRPMRLLNQVLPSAPEYPRKFDLLVVDEVHTCAPSGRGKYAVDSLRTKAIRTLAPHCEHRLFLSATPHNGYLESFTALLELLDDQRFARNVRPSETQLKRAMVRRLKSELPKKWDGSSYFGTRELDYLEVDHSAEERHAHDLLRQYSESRRGSGSRTAADFVTTLLKRRLFSSPKAFAETIEVHLATMAERERGTDDQPLAHALPVLIDRVTEAADEDDADSTRYREAEADALRVARRGVPPLSAQEKALLEQLRDWARGAQNRADRKVAALLDHLRPIVDEKDERIIIFTEYRDTQRWLHERLLGAGYAPEKIALLYGGQDVDDRERIKNVFTEDPALDPVRILLATDAASEGINLQRHCHRVLHWEIPWNPNRLEQRNGRVDRHGQPAPVVKVHHFVPKGWETKDFAEGSLEDELAFLEVAVRKVHQIREDLGSAGEVIAAQIEQKMVGERSDWQTADREIVQRSGRARLKVERDLARDLERLTEELRSSRARLNLHPETVQRVVSTALRLAHRQDLRPATPPPGFSGEVFRLPELPGAWASARNDGLRHPVTGDERPVSFDQEAVGGRTDVVLLHLGHRLVQMCMRLLRAELWAQTKAGAGGKLRRITTRVVPGDTLRVPAVIAHGRVVVTGADGSRLHEEIVSAGGLIEQGKFSLIRRVDEVDALLAAASEEPADAMRDKFTELWPALSGPLAKALNTRADQRLRSMRAMLRDRCDEEVEGIGKVLEELATSIKTALNDSEVWQQPSLFEIDERDQLNADRDALRARLEAIPEQREREEKALRRRYADPTTRWFPVAVTLLVPSAIARGATR
ncbi:MULTISPECIES: DISARM system SNF2-like helicase DrmD [Saccharothrix]|uniref:DISARM system SNF2-like helicase DrmD n=1 Tax=Saccharothrix TaxID=2071 RepID=UPI000ADB0349|nr:DISARM system SNF2-like helicase DrmD [Saccharothrix sp. CB00851]